MSEAMPHSLAAHFEKFAKANIPDDAPSYQRREMRRAFYGGAAMMMLEILELHGLEREQAGDRFDALQAEIEAFIDSTHVEALLHAVFQGHFTRRQAS